MCLSRCFAFGVFVVYCSDLLDCLLFIVWSAGFGLIVCFVCLLLDWCLFLVCLGVDFSWFDMFCFVSFGFCGYGLLQECCLNVVWFVVCLGGYLSVDLFLVGWGLIRLFLVLFGFWFGLLVLLLWVFVLFAYFYLFALVFDCWFVCFGVYFGFWVFVYVLVLVF